MPCGLTSQDHPSRAGGAIAASREAVPQPQASVAAGEDLSARQRPPGSPGDGDTTSITESPFHRCAGCTGRAAVGRNRRVSSNEQPKWNDANLDMNWLQPGQVLELPVLKGPGVIHHMWFTSHSGWANELNALSIRIYWDGRPEPGVEAPLGDFFRGRARQAAAVESVPVQVSPTGSLTCLLADAVCRVCPDCRDERQPGSWCRIVLAG